MRKLNLSRQKLVEKRDIALLHCDVRVGLRAMRLEWQKWTHVDVVAKILEKGTGHVVALKVLKKKPKVPGIILFRAIALKDYKATLLGVNLDGVLRNWEEQK